MRKLIWRLFLMLVIASAVFVVNQVTNTSPVFADSACFNSLCMGHEPITSHCTEDEVFIANTAATSVVSSNLYYSNKCNAFWAVGNSMTPSTFTVQIRGFSSGFYSTSTSTTYQAMTPMVYSTYGVQTCVYSGSSGNCTAFLGGNNDTPAHAQCYGSSCSGRNPGYYGCNTDMSLINNTSATSVVSSSLYYSYNCNAFWAVGNASTPSTFTVQIRGDNGGFYSTSASTTSQSTTPMVGATANSQTCIYVGSAGNCTAFTAYNPTNDDVLMIHGFRGPTGNAKTVPNGDTDGVDCNNTTFPFVKTTFANEGWKGHLITLGFYDGDIAVNSRTGIPFCDQMLSNGYSACSNFHNGGEGSNNEAISHIGCDLAWYIWYVYTSQGRNVQLIAHSMGGLIVRWALYGTMEQLTDSNGQPAFPPYLVVHNVITMSSPHNGGETLFGLTASDQCFQCLQGEELTTGSALLTDIDGSPAGQHPNALGFFHDAYTRWAVIGSQNDSTVPYKSAMRMNADYKLYYDAAQSPQINHGTITTDGVLEGQYIDTSANANVWICTTTNCGMDTPDSSYIHSTTGYHPVYLMYLSADNLL